MVSKEEKEQIPGQESQETAIQPTSGREAFLALLKGSNPDYNPENDDQVWSDAMGLHNDISSQLDHFRKSSESLSQSVAKDPRMGAVLAMIHGEKPVSFGYAMGKVYGRSVIDDDPDEFEKGEQELIQRMADSKAMQEKAAKNAEESIKKVEKYAADNNLSEEETSALKGKIYELANNFLMGIFGEDVAEFVNKGLNRDQDVKDAIDTGYVQGKNDNIDLKKKEVKRSAIPNLTSQADAVPVPTKPKEKSREDLYRGVKSIPGTTPRKF